MIYTSRQFIINAKPGLPHAMFADGVTTSSEALPIAD